MSETEGARGIPEIVICDGCDKRSALERINDENQLHMQGMQEVTDFAQLQQQHITEGAPDATVREIWRDEAIKQVAESALGVERGVIEVNRLNGINCQTALGGLGCARYIGYVSHGEGAVKIKQILRGEGEKA